MRDSINGVEDLDAVKAACKAEIESVLTEAELSGDKSGYVVSHIHSLVEGGESVYPFTNDEVVELLLEVETAE